MEHAVILKPEDFKNLISEVRAMLEGGVKGYMVERPMTAKEAAAYLKVTPWTLWDRIRKGVIPSELIHRSAGSVYFLPSELHQYIKNS